jgi:hypothetical protein
MACYALPLFLLQFATVYKARDSVNDTIVAVKKVNVRIKLVRGFTFSNVTLVNMHRIRVL